MGTIVESNWSEGWTPSDSEQEEFGQTAHGLLRMDNLNIDEVGTCRLSKSSTVISNNTFVQINSIFGALNAGNKLRYLFTSAGSLLRNFYAGGANTISDFGQIIFSGASTARCAFLNALGHVFAIAGSKLFKDDGTLFSLLGIAAPSAPTLSANAVTQISVDNLDGSGDYTNWSAIEDSAFNNAGATLQIHPDLTKLRATTQTVFSGTLDTTNFGGTGNSDDTDKFTFNFYVDNADLLNYVKLEFYNEDPTGGPVTDYYWKEWDFQTNIPNSPYAPFPISSGVVTQVILARSDFFQVNNDASKNWANIKAIRLTVGTLGDILITYSLGQITGKGYLDGDYQYVAVDLRDTGQYLEFGLASTIADVTVANSSIHVSRGVVAGNANTSWIFRKSLATGQFLLINQQSGSLGFSPAAFNDVTPDDTAITNSALDPQYSLEPYRVALPTNIVGMIWFRDRVVYLAQNGFFPSYRLDPGSYDARYFYELIGTQGEVALFIAKLDVGTFVVATTKDFYRVTGTFSTIVDPNSNAQIQDINIQPLGISDPAINSSFIEMEGSIMYMSSSGIRVLNNATTTLVNYEMDLLFRGETRYGIPPVNLVPANGNFIACATNGTRVYWTIPCTDGSPRTFVSTYRPVNNTIDLRGTSYWRMLTESTGAANPVCMFREDDGTIIFGAGASQFVKSIETGSALQSMDFRTQFKYGQDPNATKDSTTLAFFVDTGGAALNLKVTGLGDEGNQIMRGYTLQTYSPQLVYLDIKEHLGPSVAYEIEIYGYTTRFSLNYFILEYDAHAQLVRRKKLIAQSYGRFARRTPTAWPFRINPLGGEVICRVFADGHLVDDPSNLQSFMGSTVSNFEWVSSITTFGYDWEIELVGSKDFEFYEFQAPKWSYETAQAIERVILPYQNLGKAGRKNITIWPFRVNTLTANLTVYVRGDGIAFPPQLIPSAGDMILQQNWFNQGTFPDLLAVMWEIEIIGDAPFEFYEFGEPTVSQSNPTPVCRVILPANTFNKGGRFNIQSWPFRANALGSNLTTAVRVDGAALPLQVFTGQDQITEFKWESDSSNLAFLWEIEILNDHGYFEFYEFLPPVINQECPVPIKRAFFPYTNFGRAAKKKIAALPFIVNSFGQPITSKMFTELGLLDATQRFSAGDIFTQWWRNTQDIAAVDWQLELICESGMEFYKFMSPEIVQTYPCGVVWYLAGPLDLKYSGIVFALRFRLINEGVNLHYKVFDADEVTFEGDLTTLQNEDSTYIVELPKGVSTEVCRVDLTSTTVFYPFSIDFKIRLTGKETEQQWVAFK